jgi:hypothetical protein
MADKFQGREVDGRGPFQNAVAPTLSDSVDDPAGVSQAIVCTGTGGNVKVTLVGGTTITLAIATGWSGLLPLRVQRVWTTGTTATGLLLLYV